MRRTHPIVRSAKANRGTIPVRHEILPVGEQSVTNILKFFPFSATLSHDPGFRARHQNQNKSFQQLDFDALRSSLIDFLICMLSFMVTSYILNAQQLDQLLIQLLDQFLRATCSAVWSNSTHGYVGQLD